MSEASTNYKHALISFMIQYACPYRASIVLMKSTYIRCIRYIRSQNTIKSTYTNVFAYFCKQHLNSFHEKYKYNSMYCDRLTTTVFSSLCPLLTLLYNDVTRVRKHSRVRSRLYALCQQTPIIATQRSAVLTLAFICLSADLFVDHVVINNAVTDSCF